MKGIIRPLVEDNMTERQKRRAREHHHRGKSSEGFLDKEKILTALSIRLGETVLDAGCGNGYMAKEFDKLVGERGKVYALDPDTASIEKLQSETKDRIIDPFVGDITRKTKLQASSIDLIYVSTVLHGFSPAQMNGFTNEVERILKPKGRVAVVEMKKEETPFGPPLSIRFSPEELRQAIRLHPRLLIDVGAFFYMQVFQK
jgi:ubiquinone/menaquinone biosynthesis C-methylase UbiE